MANRNKKVTFLLFLIIVLACSLRLYGITMEVPHPDSYTFVEGAMRYGLTNVEPASEFGSYALYVAPGFTVVILLIAIFSLFYMVGYLLGMFSGLESFEMFYHANMDLFYILSSVSMVAVGTGTIIVVYFLAKRIFDQKTGLLSALFLGVSFMHSMHSQFVRMDIMALFFILLSIYYSLAILESKNTKSYILAGLFGGASIASKYTSGLIVVVIFIVHLLSNLKDIKKDTVSGIKSNLLIIPLIITGTVLCAVSIWVNLADISLWAAKYLSPGGALGENSLRLLQVLYSKMLYVGIIFILTAYIIKTIKPLNYIIVNLILEKKFAVSMLAVAVAFVTLNPIFLPNLDKIISIFINDPNYSGKNSLFVGVDRLEGIKTHLWYLKGPLRWGMGTHIALLGLAGFIISIFRITRKEIVLLTFPLLYFLFIGMGHYKWERYVIPLLPFVAIYAGKFLVEFVSRMSRILPEAYQKKENYLLIGIAIIIIINPVYNIIRYDNLLTQPDTRNISAQWVEKHIPVKSKIGQDYYTGILPEEMFAITKKYSLSQEKSLDEYRSEGYHYILVSSTMYDRYFAEPDKYRKNVEFYKRLFTECELVKEFKPDANYWPPPGERFLKYHIHVSPTIKIYKLI